VPEDLSIDQTDPYGPVFASYGQEQPVTYRMETVKTKWGNIIILSPSSDNYKAFSSTCRSALVSANAWNIIQRVEEEPEAPNLRSMPTVASAYKDYIDRRGKANTILNSSVDYSLHNAYLDPYILTVDVAAMWEALATTDQSSDPIVLGNVQVAWHKESFDPNKEVFQDFLIRLTATRSKLNDSKYNKTDDDVLERILYALPQIEPWAGVRLYCMRQELKLAEAINTIKSTETTLPERSFAAVAAVTVATRGNWRGARRGRGRGGRGRGRVRGLGENNTNSRDTSRTRDSRAAGCFYCLKEGHFQTDCRAYKASRDSFLKNSGSEDKAQAQLAVASSSQFTYGSSCFYSLKSLLSGAVNHVTARLRVVTVLLRAVAAESSSAKAHIAYALNLNPQAQWALDSGATHHYSGSVSDFGSSLKRWRLPRTITIANGMTVRAYGQGQIQLAIEQEGPYLMSTTLQLRDAWYAPDFGNTRLISVSCLNDEGYELHFKNREAIAIRSGEAVCKFRGTEGLYLLRIDNNNTAFCATVTASESAPTPVIAPAEVTIELTASESAPEPVIVPIVTVESRQKLWHRRMGHANLKYVDKLLTAAEGVSYSKPSVQPGDEACEACLAGKMKESFNKTTDNRSDIKLRRLHADISGILPASFRGYRYFLLVVDDATRYIWIRLLKDKSTAEILPKIKEIKAEAELESDRKVVFFRSDNGKGEFGLPLQGELKAIGIQFEPSPPYKHSMNGVIERMMGTLAVKMRSMIFESRMDEKIWDYAAEHSVYLINRTPTAALPFTDQYRLDEAVMAVSTAVTPFEAYKDGRRPQLRNLKAFGCKAIIGKSKQKFPHKMDPRIEGGEHVFVGMQGSSIWRLLDTKSLRETLSADVEFNEYHFPKVVGSIKPPLGGAPLLSGPQRPDNLETGILTTVESSTPLLSVSPARGSGPLLSGDVRPTGRPRLENQDTSLLLSSTLLSVRPLLSGAPTSASPEARGPGLLLSSDIRPQGNPRPLLSGDLRPENGSQSLARGPSPLLSGEVRPTGVPRPLLSGTLQEGNQIRPVTLLSDQTEPVRPVTLLSEYERPVTVGVDHQAQSAPNTRGRGPVNTTASAPRVRGVAPIQSLSFIKPTRSGRNPIKHIFGGRALAAALAAVNLVEGPETLVGEPTAQFEAITVNQAMQEDAPQWLAAMRSELISLKKMGTYRVVQRPQASRPIGTKWVLRKKYNADGAVARYKARLVGKGFQQRSGIDYYSTFASVARYTTLRFLLAWAAANNLEMDQVDIETAFLNPVLEEEIYMEIPEFFASLHLELEGQDVCLRLLKSLYGLKQAPRVWFLAVKSFLESQGFTAATSDPSLFVKAGICVLVYVDDMLLVGDRQQVDAVKASLNTQWQCKDLGEAGVFLGFQIVRDREARTITIHQELYTTKLLERLGLDRANSTILPMPAGTILRATAIDGENDAEYQELDEAETYLYRQTVGSVIHLSNCTRPEIAYNVGQLARFMSKPLTGHLRSAKLLMRYLTGTKGQGITYGPDHDRNTYQVYSDATWGTEDDRKSFLGWVVIKSGGAVSWAAQRQKSTSLSTMDAEFVSASEASREVAWMEKLHIDLGIRSFVPTLRCDNEAAIALCQDTKFHNKAKHIDIRYNYVRNDMIESGRLLINHIAGVEQLADILTKQLPVDAFQKHKRGLGIL
jgi:hypothetical protein